jgi:hypothetical protein
LAGNTVVSARTATGDHAVFETRRNNAITTAFGIDDSGSYTNATVGSSAFLGTNGETLHFVTGAGFAGSAGNITTGGAWTLGHTSSTTSSHTVQGAMADFVLKVTNNRGTASTDNGLQVTVNTSGATSALKVLQGAGTLFNVAGNGVCTVTTASWGTGGTAVGVSGGLLTTSPSSARYKENIRTIDAAEIDSSLIYQLPVKIFEYKQEKGGKTSFGGIAEEVALILPQLVNYEEFEGDLVPESISENKICWLLLEEMKKLKARIEALESGN